MTSSDERREVAARLREFADTDVWLSAMFAELEKFGDTDRPRADAIADLIDPICEDEGTITQDWPDGSSTYLHELSCGHTCETIYAGAPAFCPYCGARVVDDDRRGDAV